MSRETSAGLQRQIRDARISRALSAVPAVIFTVLFAVHLAGEELFLSVLNAVAVVLFAASIVITTARIRLLRTRVRIAASLASPSSLPVAGTGTTAGFEAGTASLPAPAPREALLRRIAHRPRKTMTPDDYKRLREMETELGWEPSKVPESLAASGVVALEPRKPSAACDCCEDSLAVDVRAFGSAAPVARYCAECGRQRKRHEAAPSKALTARAKVSYGGTAALSGSGSLSAKATWDDVAYASEASEHFAQLARVGRESCISPCRMCEERWLETERWGGNEH